MMDLGEAFACECGKTHRPATRVLLGKGAVGRVAESLDGSGIRGCRVMVVMDRNTRGAAGDAAMGALSEAGAVCRDVVLDPEESGDGQLEPDELQIMRVLDAFEPGSPWIASAGSGVITDICRYVAAKVGAGHISFATAPSMDGYTSSVAPLIIRGFKKTFQAKAPWLLVADTDILSSAPPSMVAAGYGDLVGKLTANSDWLAARHAFGEFRCSRCWAMLESALSACSRHPEGIRDRDPAYVEVLTRGLIDSGIAIMYTGNSRPASGAEHLVSHAWEMKALYEHVRPELHGAQVGVATVMISRLYGAIFDLDPSTLDMAGLERSHRNLDDYVPQLEKAFGKKASAEILRETGSRDRSWEGRLGRIESLVRHWDEIKAAIRPVLPGPAEISDMLRRAGAPASADELGIPKDWVRDAFRLAHQLRNRYTAINLAEDLGVLDGFVESL